jgi:hypothetical protein
LAWDVDSGSQIANWSGFERVAGVAFADNGNTLVTAGMKILRFGSLAGRY